MIRPEDLCPPQPPVPASLQNQQLVEQQSIPTNFESLENCTIWERFYIFLLKKGLMNADAMPAGKASEFSLPSMNSDEIQKLANIFHEKLTLRTKSMEYSIEYTFSKLIRAVSELLTEQYPHLKLVRIYLTGSAVFKVLGWSYLVRFFEQLGISIQDIPKEIIQDILSEINKPLNDVDIRCMIPGIERHERDLLQKMIIYVFSAKFREKYKDPSVNFEELIYKEGFTKLSNVNLYDLNTFFLTTGFGDRIQTDSELIWVNSLKRLHLAVHDALMLEVPFFLLEENALLFSLLPECSYRYPVKVFLDRILKLKTYDEIETVDKSGLGRMVLDSIKGFTYLSEKDELIVLLTLFKQVIISPLNKVDLLLAWLLEIPKSHGGRTPEYRIVYALKILTALSKMIGVQYERMERSEKVMHTYLTAEELEYIRRGLLKGLWELNQELPFQLRCILGILQEPAYTATQACHYIQDLHYLGFLFKPNTIGEKYVYDRIRSPHELQIRIACRSQVLWYKIPSKPKKPFSTFLELAPAGDHFWLKCLYGEILENLLPAPNQLSMSLDALDETAKSMCQHPASLTAALGTRILLSIQAKRSCYSNIKYILSNLPRTLPFEQNLGNSSLLALIRSQFPELESCLPVENEIEFPLLSSLIMEGPIEYFPSIIELITRYPLLLQKLKECCFASAKANPAMVLRLWMKYPESIQGPDFEILLPKIISGLRNSTQIVKVQANTHFLCQKALHYLKTHPDKTDLDLDLFELIKIDPSNGIAVLHQLTEGKHLESHAKTLLNIWLNVGLCFNGDKNLSCRLLLVYIQQQNNKEYSVLQLLQVTSKALLKPLKNSDKDQLDSYKSLHLSLLELLSNLPFPYAPKSSQWLMAHFFEMEKYDCEYDKLLLIQLCTRVLQIIRSMGEKFNNNAWQMIEANLPDLLDKMFKWNLHSQISGLIASLMALRKEFQLQSFIWQTILSLGSAVGSLKLLSSTFDRVYAYLDNALSQDPPLSIFESPVIYQGISDHILERVKNKDVQSANRWKKNLKKLTETKISQDIGSCWIQILKLHVSRKEWVEAAEILVSDSERISILKLNVINELYSTLAGLKEMKSSSSALSSLLLMKEYNISIDLDWENLYRKIETFQDKVLAELAWNIFWDFYEPKNVKHKNSILLSVTQAINRCQSPLILAAASPQIDQRIVKIVGTVPDQKYFRTFATQFLTGVLPHVLQDKSLSLYSDVVLRWRFALNRCVTGNTNFRSIDVPLIKALCQCNNISLAREACEIFDNLIKVDTSFDHVNDRGEAAIAILSVLFKTGDEQDLDKIKRLYTYVHNNGLLLEFLKPLVEAFIHSDRPCFLKIKVDYFAKLALQSNFKVLEKDESSPYMVGVVELFTLMVKDARGIYHLKIEQLFLNDMVLKSASPPWLNLFKKWCDGLIACARLDPKNVHDCCQWIFKHPILLSKLNDKTMINTLVDLILTSSEEDSHNTLQMIRTQLFSQYDEKKSVTSIQHHPYQEIRYLFIKTLLVKAYEEKQWMCYSKIVEFCLNFFEVFLNKPNDHILINIALAMIVEYIPRFSNTDAFNLTVIGFLELIVSVKEFGRRGVRAESECKIKRYQCTSSPFISHQTDNLDKQKDIKSNPRPKPEVMVISEANRDSDFCLPTYFVALSITSYTAGKFTSFVPIMCSFLRNILDVKTTLPMHKGFILETVHANLIEVVAYIINTKCTAPIELTEILFKFISLSPNTLSEYKQHETRYKKLINQIACLPFPPQSKVEDLLICNLYAVLHSRNKIELSSEKFRGLLVKIFNEHCKMASSELMVYRFERVLKIFVEYHKDFLSNPEAFHAAQKIFFDFFERILAGNEGVKLLKKEYLFELLMPGYKVSSKDDLQDSNHSPNSKLLILQGISNFFMHMIICVDTPVKFIRLMEIFCTTQKLFQTSNWTEYFALLDKWNPVFLNLSKKYPELYTVYFKAFELLKYENSIPKGMRSVVSRINSLLTKLVQENQKGLAQKIFEEAERLNCYEKLPNLKEAAIVILK